MSAQFLAEMTPIEAVAWATQNPNARFQVTIEGKMGGFEYESTGKVVVTVAGREIELTNLWHTAAGTQPDPQVKIARFAD